MNSKLESNRVKDYEVGSNGGACFLNETATLLLVNTALWNNTADDAGGAVAMGSTK